MGNPHKNQLLAVPLEIINYIRNYKFLFVFEVKKSVKKGWLNPDDKDGVAAHSGFLQQYDSVRDDVWDIVNQRLEEFPSTTEIFIAGHSMGGALTILCALDFAYSREKYRVENQHLKCKICVHDFYLLSIT